VKILNKIFNMFKSNELTTKTKKEVGYFLQLSKTTDLNGEVVTISTNLPVGATEDEIVYELLKIGGATRMQMIHNNELKLNSKIKGEKIDERGNNN